MKHVPHSPSPSVRTRGFMLIEVLVSILIFSIGVLALVGLQAKMTHAQSASKIRTDATYLANELIGTMWSDLTHLGSYANCASYGPCSDWQTKVSQSLPNGSGTVDSVDPSTGAVSITIKWTVRSDGEHRYTTIAAVKSSS
jgi:type IV pilus assembly protein PilV